MMDLRVGIKGRAVEEVDVFCSIMEYGRYMEE
jgi:hypothetical protein